MFRRVNFQLVNPVAHHQAVGIRYAAFQRIEDQAADDVVVLADALALADEGEPDLIPYVESLGLKYHYIRDDIVERAAEAGKDGKMGSGDEECDEEEEEDTDVAGEI